MSAYVAEAGWNQTLLGPASPADRAEWLANLKAYRTATLKSINYNGSVYDTELLWTPSSFISPQVMLHERTLFNDTLGQFTVDAYLDDLERRYGGIDSVLVWQSYPNIGIDAQSQFDMFLNLPGGLPSITKMVADFHKRGVKVLFPYNPWDQGTQSNGKPDYVTLPELLAEVQADGFNGDTMHSIPVDFWSQGLADHNPLALEPEGGGQLETLSFSKMGWGYWFSVPYPFVPMVDIWKWLESRHITHICNRWAWNHTDDIQSAFFNGEGFVTWENVWGVWQGMTPRDSAATRRVSAMLRYFAPAFVSPDWEPHTVGPTVHGVYASMWPVPNSQQVVWTIVNRGNTNVSGTVMTIPMPAGFDTFSWFDAYNGAQLQPAVSGDMVSFAFDIEELGYGCLLRIPTAEVTEGLHSFIKSMAVMTARHLSSYEQAMVVQQQQIVPIAAAPQPTMPETMVKIPATDSYTFEVHGIMIETDNDRPGIDFQYPWEDFPTLYHTHKMSINAFYIDKYPVTNARYKAFLEASDYRPTDTHNFLKDWHNFTTYPAGWDKKPVTWVSLEDARAFCAWHKVRLPNEWEWQYAAQGTSNPPLKYPWGNDWDPTRVPAADKGRTLSPPDRVDAHPTGASQFGVMDLVGNIWQWTNEYEDPHTRGAALKGGSYYYPQGSMWYFPQGHELDTHGKYLMMAPSLDRAGALGFRCAADVA